MSRILAVDPGEARIGLAVSDPSEKLARPLRVVRHASRAEDARQIVAIARQEQAEAIVVGVAYGDEGQTGRSAQRGLRLAKLCRAGSRVETWDESGSTVECRDSRKPDEMTDARAAVILQSYSMRRRRRSLGCLLVATFSSSGLASPLRLPFRREAHLWVHRRAACRPWNARCWPPI
jgi:putative Holliday junction resolvase